MGMDRPMGEMDYAVLGGGFGSFPEGCFGGCRRRLGDRRGC